MPVRLREPESDPRAQFDKRLLKKLWMPERVPWRLFWYWWNCLPIKKYMVVVILEVFWVIKRRDT